MAIASACIWEVRSTATADNVNGGFYNASTGTNDYSQQPAAQYTLTNGAVTNGSAVITHASAAADMVGNGLKINSGTNATVAWYEVISVVVGVSVTVDRSVATGIGSDVAFNIGGALAFDTYTGASSVANALNTSTAGNIWYIKNGTYTFTSSTTMSAAGSAANPINLIGYNATRNDNPVDGGRPLFALGTTTFSQTGNFVSLRYVMFTGTAANTVTVTSNDWYCVAIKITNSSTTAGRNCLNLIGGNSIVRNSELVSYRGNCVSAQAVSTFMGCYFHDSNQAITTTGGGNMQVFINNIFEGIVTNAFVQTTAYSTGGGAQFWGNTFYGAQNKLGNGINIITASTGVRAFNNIFYGYATAVQTADVGQTYIIDNYNNYFNNTADNTNWVKGPNDIALNPNFTNVTQVTGTNGTTSGSVLTSSGANFPTFVPGVDFLYLVSGTGITTGIYGIVSNTSTTITLDIAPGTSATADKVFQVTSGHNFNVGQNMRNQANPGLFAGGLTTSSADLGAVQASTTTGSSSIG